MDEQNFNKKLDEVIEFLVEDFSDDIISKVIDLLVVDYYTYHPIEVSERSEDGD